MKRVACECCKPNKTRQERELVLGVVKTAWCGVVKHSTLAKPTLAGKSVLLERALQIMFFSFTYKLRLNEGGRCVFEILSLLD